MGDGPGTWECESTSGIVAISVRSLRRRVSEAMAGVLSGGEVCNDYNERLTSFVNSAIPGGDCKSVRRKRKKLSWQSKLFAWNGLWLLVGVLGVYWHEYCITYFRSDPATFRSLLPPGGRVRTTSQHPPGVGWFSLKDRLTPPLAILLNSGPSPPGKDRFFYAAWLVAICFRKMGHSRL